MLVWLRTLNAYSCQECSPKDSNRQCRKNVHAGCDVGVITAAVTVPKPRARQRSNVQVTISSSHAPNPKGRPQACYFPPNSAALMFCMSPERLWPFKWSIPCLFWGSRPLKRHILLLLQSWRDTSPPCPFRVQLWRREALNTQGSNPPRSGTAPRAHKYARTVWHISFTLKLPNLVFIKQQLPNLSKKNPSLINYHFCGCWSFVVSDRYTWTRFLQP